MSSAFRIIIAVALFAGAGCESNSHGVATAYVSGEVTLEGSPLDHGAIMFTPSRGRGASGVIQPDGTYELTTYTPGDGAIVGEHEVTIVCMDQPPSAPGEFVEVGKIPKWLIPRRYGEASTSGLRFTVVADENNVADFDLKNK